MRIYPKDLVLVSIQLLLLILYAVDCNWSLGVSHWAKIISLIIAISGLMVVLIAIVQLNRNLSPFPTPKKKAILLQTGLYKIVRHPIYSGLIVFFFGYGFYKDSGYKIIVAVLFVVLFHFKTRYEEQQLQNKFKDYQSYKVKTYKFFPFF